jgi:hypothetical protein
MAQPFKGLVVLRALLRALHCSTSVRMLSWDTCATATVHQELADRSAPISQLARPAGN